MSDFSFPKRLRLTASAGFARVFQDKSGLTKRIKTNYFVLLFIPNAGAYPRLGVVISKKNIHGACRRNCLRRIARESFRVQKQLLNSFDIVLLIYNKADQLSKFEWRTILDQQWKKLNAA